MSKIYSFRDLVIWQKSKLLVIETYKAISQFPSKEKFCLHDQMQRAAISIPSNIAEGYGRQSRQDYKRFLQIAKGSLYELQTQFDIAVELGYIDKTKIIQLMILSNELDKMFYALIKKLST